ncbi:MAG TPA: hypothetical protein VK137_09545 [Planctomycetaceae bacterium]|nr:hypothetical protein [Planctomycetaceae bacterium]
MAALNLSLPRFAVSQEAKATADPKVEDRTRTPIPADNAPDEIKRLIEDGKVTVVYDSDPEFVKAGRGWADFHIQLKHSFRYSLTKTQRRGKQHLTITVTKLEPQIELTHIIRLPVPYKSPRVWDGNVLRHEFDHVAISLDPRPLLLFKHLLLHLPPIEMSLEPKEQPSEAAINQRINDAIDQRHTAVRDVIRANNITLDKVSQHGGIPIPGRAEFFAKLYTKENLAEQKFPFIDEVLGLLESPEYQQARPRILPRDPTEN